MSTYNKQNFIPGQILTAKQLNAMDDGIAALYAEEEGYYTPAIKQVDESTIELTYTASKEDMPAVETQHITLPAGKQGNPGVFVGPATKMPEGCNISIDPDGESPALVRSINGIGPDDNGNIEVNMDGFKIVRANSSENPVDLSTLLTYGERCILSGWFKARIDEYNYKPYLFSNAYAFINGINGTAKQLIIMDVEHGNFYSIMFEMNNWGISCNIRSSSITSSIYIHTDTFGEAVYDSNEPTTNIGFSIPEGFRSRGWRGDEWNLWDITSPSILRGRWFNGSSRQQTEYYDFDYAYAFVCGEPSSNIGRHVIILDFLNNTRYHFKFSVNEYGWVDKSEAAVLLAQSAIFGSDAAVDSSTLESYTQRAETAASNAESAAQRAEQAVSSEWQLLKEASVSEEDNITTNFDISLDAAYDNFFILLTSCMLSEGSTPDGVQATVDILIHNGGDFDTVVSKNESLLRVGARGDLLLSFERRGPVSVFEVLSKTFSNDIPIRTFSEQAVADKVSIRALDAEDKPFVCNYKIYVKQ